MATAVHKKQTESKYVTLFADSRPDVDVTFRDVLLSRPTDHYLVGVDNFSMTNTSLSMIEPMTKDKEFFLRIVRRLSEGVLGKSADDTALALALAAEGHPLANLYIGTNGAGAGDWAFEISSQEVILSVQQLMHRLGEVAGDVCRYMNEDQCKTVAQGGLFAVGYTPAAGNADTTHLKFELATDGRLRIIGTRAFWANFAIEVSATRNQFGLFGPRTETPTDFTNQRRFLTLNAATSEARFDNIQVRLSGAYSVASLVPSALSHHDPGWELGYVDLIKSGANAEAHETLAFQTQASIFSSLERRVALELGCSLPIKNSPMIDHQKETPDFVLARWIWRTDPRIESNDQGGSRRYHSMMPACTEYQGAQDRISYHELQPQSKIQTLRLKLFARLRSFNEIDETYRMRVIALPTSATDWWHTRIHFMSRD